MDRELRAIEEELLESLATGKIKEIQNRTFSLSCVAEDIQAYRAGTVDAYVLPQLTAKNYLKMSEMATDLVAFLKKHGSPPRHDYMEREDMFRELKSELEALAVASEDWAHVQTAFKGTGSNALAVEQTLLDRSLYGWLSLGGEFKFSRDPFTDALIGPLFRYLKLVLAAADPDQTSTELEKRVGKYLERKRKSGINILRT